ncbi:MAG: PKD domain-containing protein [Candidatus Thermoplasmatota archaeon]
MSRAVTAAWTLVVGLGAIPQDDAQKPRRAGHGVPLGAAAPRAPQMRPGRLFPLTALVVCGAILLMGTAAAHPIPLPWDGYQRMVADCEDDYGFHANKPWLKGHEIHGLDIKEVADGVRLLTIYEKKFRGQVGSVAAPDPDYPQRDILTFKVAGRSMSSTLETTGNGVPSVTGTPATSSARYDVPDTSQPGIDDGRYGIELTYTYEALGVKNGEAITDFKIEGWVDVGTGWQRGDVMPGGYYNGATYLTDCTTYNGEHGKMPMEQAGGYTVTQRPMEDPVAAFTTSPSAPKAGQAVSFIDASTDADNAITSWVWNFGDGGTSSDRSPTHTYSEAGTYTIQLTVTDATSRTGARAQTLTITPADAVDQPPVAQFTHAPASPRSQENVTFTDTSTDTEGPISGWNWTFGEGNTTTQRNPTHSYARPGNYTITLTVTDAAGTDANVSRTIIVQNRAPLVSLILNATARVNETVTFQHNSSDLDGRILSTQWAFGDGNESGLGTPTHRYPTPGNYTITLRVTDNNGTSTTAMRNLSVLAIEVVPPQVVILVENTSSLTQETVLFRGQAAGPAPIAVWHWTFGAEGASDAQNATHAFARPGAHGVTLRVTDQRGISNETQVTVTVANRVPILAVSVTYRVDLGTPFIPNATASDPDGTIHAWEWDFGDGDTATGEDPTHTYSSTGDYTLRIRVTDDFGGIAEATSTIRVRLPGQDESDARDPNSVHPAASDDASSALTANFSVSATEIGLGDKVVFTDTSTGSIRQRVWSMGDGATYRSTQFEYDYVLPGTYNVTLTITDTTAKTATHAQRIVVKAPTPPISPPADDAPTTPSTDPSDAVPATPPDKNETPTPGTVWVLFVGIVLVSFRRLSHGG